MKNKEIFIEALNEIKEKRFKKILNSKDYLNSCYENDEILSLSNRLGEIKIEIAKAEIDKQETQNLEKKQAELKKELLIKLKESGKDVDKLIPSFDCKFCNDTGFYNEQPCSCLTNLYFEKLLNNSNISLKEVPQLNEIDIKRYDNFEEKELLISNLNKIINSKYNTILFSGQTGTGKSYIARSIIKTFILQDLMGKYYSSREVNNLFKEAYFNIQSQNYLLKDIYNCDVLVIDDLGTEPINKNITVESFLDLLNHRQSTNKVTIFTTNLTLNDIKEKYNERFLSRLIDKNISFKYNFKGKDIRLI